MLEPVTPNPIPDHIQPPPLPITVDDEPEFKISEILDSKIDNCIVPANYCILSVGQGMRVLTKKPLGYSLPNSDMLLN